MGGIFGGGGGGGGKQTQTSEASYPPEFRDLATSARKQIEALQAALPLVSHAGFQPAGVAGLSPVEQFTINELVMRAPYLPATFASLMELPEPVGAASRGAVRAGEGSRGAAGALDYLSDFLGRDVRPSPVVMPAFPTMTRWPVPETAFPGLTRETLEAARPGIATQPVSHAQPIPSAPTPPPPPPSPASPTLPSLTSSPAFAAAFPEFAVAEQLSARHGGIPIITRAEALSRGLVVDSAGQAWTPQEAGIGTPVAAVILGPQPPAMAFNESPGDGGSA